MTTRIRNEQFAALDGWVSAQESWSYASSDDPTFTFTISGDKTGKYHPGMRIKLTQTTSKYFIITAVSYGAPNTTVTVYGGTDYDLANAAITSPFYSMMKAPYGFPLDPIKWSIQATDNTERSQLTPTAGTWYNLSSVMSIVVPIGAWSLEYFANVSVDDATPPVSVFTTLGTTTSAESDSDFRGVMYFASSGTIPVIVCEVSRRKNILLAAKATYYVLAATGNSGIDKIRMNLGIGSTNGKTVIRAVCSYL